MEHLTLSLCYRALEGTRGCHLITEVVAHFCEEIFKQRTILCGQNGPTENFHLRTVAGMKLRSLEGKFKKTWSFVAKSLPPGECRRSAKIYLNFYGGCMKVFLRFIAFL